MLYTNVRHGSSAYAFTYKLRTPDNGKTWFVKRSFGVNLDGSTLEQVTEEVTRLIQEHGLVDAEFSNKVEFDYYGEYAEVNCEIVGWERAEDDLVALIDLSKLTRFL